MRPRRALALTLLASAAHAQWQILDAHTSASLRGVHALGHGIVWASGTEGTVLRSTDDGKTWTHCPTPPDADKLDFRGIQAFDASTAIVMSSGKGDLSRLYKTTDGCATWKLIFTNPDKDGFWDALQFWTVKSGVVAGDPANHDMTLFRTENGGATWTRNKPDIPAQQLKADNWKWVPQSLFAASNSSLLLANDPTGSGPKLLPDLWIGTGGPVSSSLVLATAPCANDRIARRTASCYKWIWVKYPAALAGDNASSGIFSIASRITGNDDEGFTTRIFVMVGGDYLKPNESRGTASYAEGNPPKAYSATTPPHGYRSAVAYDAPHKTWITVGPNGTDISTDDGRNWRALTPSPTDAPNADKNWNALSLPFVVGPQGRIGKLRNDALTPPKALTR